MSETLAEKLRQITADATVESAIRADERAKVIEECVEAIDTQKYRGCDEFGVGHEQGCEDAITAIRALGEKNSD